MLTVITVIAVILAIAIAVILALAARKPDDFRYERSIVVDAPADRIYPFVSDFRKWIVWSPYEAKDPDMKRTYGERAEGVGAVYAWDGNREIGAGRMEIADAAQPSLIRIRLDFFRPFKANNLAEFIFTPTGGQTHVTWAMNGKSNFMSKVLCTVMNVDRMVGNDFDKGLKALKAAAEGVR
jgi:hypothetical protein